MSTAITAVLVIGSLITAFISGIFGMAGGMMLIGILALILPVHAAFVSHGILQLVANGWRAVLHWRHINVAVFSWFALATIAAGLIVSAIGYVPSKPLLFLLLGLMPLLLWVPKGWFTPDAAMPSHAIGAGFVAAALNLTAGVSGPLIDTVFVRTGLTRHQIVATKAAIQSLNHVSKIIVYGIPLLSYAHAGLPPLWLFALAIPASMLGTTAGGWVLDRMSDVNFKRWTAWIVTGIGAVYLVKAVQIWAV
jgi:uncharacterized protein